MSKSELHRLEIMNPNIVQKIREEIVRQINEAANAGPITDDLDYYWVAGMMYAAKIAQGKD